MLQGSDPLHQERSTEFGTIDLYISDHTLIDIECKRFASTKESHVGQFWCLVQFHTTGLGKGTGWIPKKGQQRICDSSSSGFFDKLFIPNSHHGTVIDGIDDNIVNSKLLQPSLMTKVGRNNASTVGKGSSNPKYQNRLTLYVFHHVDFGEWVESPTTKEGKQQEQQR